MDGHVCRNRVQGPHPCDRARQRPESASAMGQSGQKVRPKMSDSGPPRRPPKRLRERHRHRVSDPAGDAVPGSVELVVIGERLKRRRFSEADRAVLLGMTKTSVREAVATAGQRRGDPVPPHASIHVAEAAGAAVAIQLEPLRPIPAAAAIGRGGSDPLEIPLRQARGVMIGDGGVAIAGVYGREAPDGRAPSTRACQDHGRETAA